MINRYQFEDLISEYIENELSLPKRKEFEQYLEENLEAKSLVDSVRTTMIQMKTLPKAKVSAGFNERLMATIQKDRDKLLTPAPSQKTYLGFTPIHASLMTGLVIAFVFIGIQLISPEGKMVNNQTQYYADDPTPSLSNPSLKEVNLNPPDFADLEEDSTLEESKNKPKKDFSKQMHFVNDQ
mgnify:FL=1